MDPRVSLALAVITAFFTIGLIAMILFQAHRARKRLAADMRAYREAADRAERQASSFTASGGP